MGIIMRLSIVIPAKNEEKNIINLLDCLDKQTFKNFDIIIADASSTDFTVLNSLSHKLSYKIKIVKGGLPGIGRNNGAKKSKSKFILFIDADATITDNNLLQKSIDLITKKNLDLVTTNISCRNSNAAKFIYMLNNTFQFLSKFDVPFATGMYFFIRKSKFDELNGFNEEDQFAEDYNLSRKINRKKFDIVKSFVYSDDRRFKKTGYLGMMKLFYKTMKNKKNESYYKEKINYF
jgi:glycosyltransferase involved in cell wall biosynthesis